MREDVADARFALAVARTRDLAAVDEAEHDRRFRVVRKAPAEFDREALRERRLADAGRSAQEEALDQAAPDVRAPLVFGDRGDFGKQRFVRCADQLRAVFRGRALRLVSRLPGASGPSC